LIGAQVASKFRLGYLKF
jgi:hypothetical protein